MNSAKLQGLSVNNGTVGSSGLIMTSFQTPLLISSFTQSRDELKKRLVVNARVKISPAPFPCSTPNDPYDTFTTIGISCELLIKLKTLSGRFIEITVGNTFSRYVRVIAVSDEWMVSSSLSSSEIVWIPPMLFHNIGFNPYLDKNIQCSCQSIADYFNHDLEIKHNDIQRYQEHQELRECAHVTISRVKSPFSSGLRNYSQFLTKFFTTPRILREGDIFPVHAPLETSPYCNQSHHLINHNEIIYFKVTNLIGVENSSKEHKEKYESNNSQMIVSCQHSKLFQVGAISCSVIDPLLIKPFLLASLPSSPTPPLLMPQDETVIEQLNELLASFSTKAILDSSSSSSSECLQEQLNSISEASSLLLHGKRESGKMKLIKTSAARMGYHMVEVLYSDTLLQTPSLDLFSLSSGNKNKVSRQQMKQTIELSFQRAESQSPCILVLPTIPSSSSSSSSSSSPSSSNEATETPDIEGYAPHHPANIILSCLKKLHDRNHQRFQQFQKKPKFRNKNYSCSFCGDTFRDSQQEVHIQKEGGCLNCVGRATVVVVGVCDDDDLESLDLSWQAVFMNQIRIPSPNFKLRLELLHHFIQASSSSSCQANYLINKHANGLRDMAHQLKGRGEDDIATMINESYRIALLRSLATHKQTKGNKHESDSLEPIGISSLFNSVLRVDALASMRKPVIENKRLSDYLIKQVTIDEPINDHNTDDVKGTHETTENENEWDIGLEDMEKAVSKLAPLSNKQHNELDIPQVHWEDVGGLQAIREEILQIIELPNEDVGGGMMKSSLRSGILLFGPPGSGKTLVAKAVATECGLPFLSVKGPELLDMYVGESEKKIRQIFQLARSVGGGTRKKRNQNKCNDQTDDGNIQMVNGENELQDDENISRPAGCVLFFDELDALAPARGRGNDGGGVMDRVVSQFLTEMDTVARYAPPCFENHNKHFSTSLTMGPVFVIGATNRPDLLDPSLLRPGRFDRLLYMGISNDVKPRSLVLKACTRNLPLDHNVNIETIAEKHLKTNFSGADIASVCSHALLLAMKRKITEVNSNIEKFEFEYQKDQRKDNKNCEQETERLSISLDDYLKEVSSKSPSQLIPMIRHQDFINAALTIQPSVSSKELKYYESLKSTFASH